MTDDTRITIVEPFNPDDPVQVRRACRNVERGHAASRDVNWGLVIAAMVFLVLAILFAAAHPAAGSTDVPPARHRTCLHYRIAWQSEHQPAMRFCVRYSR